MLIGLWLSVAMAQEPAKWKVLEVGKDDQRFSEASAWIGKLCTPVSPIDKGDGWYGGSFKCEGDLEPFFIMVRFQTSGASSSAKPSTTSSTSGSAAGRWKLIEISPDDAYYSQRADHVGVYCTPNSPEDRDGGWVGGSFSCDGGWDPYFFKARFDKGSAAAAPRPAPASTAGRWTLVEISSEDAYYDSRDKYVGLTCAPTGPSDKGGGWYGGNFDCDGGFSPYFYKARFDKSGAPAAVAPRPAPAPAPVARPAPAPAPAPVARPAPAPKPTSGVRGPTTEHYRGAAYNAAAGTTVKRGAKLALIDIEDGDPTVSSATHMIGDECKSTTTLVSKGDGWWAGEIACGGSPVFFQRAAFVLLR